MKTECALFNEKNIAFTDPTVLRTMLPLLDLTFYRSKKPKPLDTLLPAKQLKQAEAFVKWANAIISLQKFTERATGKGDKHEFWQQHLKTELDDCLNLFKRAFGKTLTLLENEVVETNAAAQCLDLKAAIEGDCNAKTIMKSVESAASKDFKSMWMEGLCNHLCLLDELPKLFAEVNAKVFVEVVDDMVQAWHNTNDAALQLVKNTVGDLAMAHACFKTLRKTQKRKTEVEKAKDVVTLAE